MQYEEIQKLLLKDTYIDIAFKRYKSFKETSSDYDESYKKEVLTRLNEFLRGQEINEFTVVDVVKKIQKENPTSGSFAHWSNTQDLVKFAEGRPEEVATLLYQLYHSSSPLEERIEQFREKGKAFNPNISLGAPLFGYLLAAFDARKYPLYKQEIVTDVKKSYGIDLKLGTVGANYETFVTFCKIALDHFQPAIPDLTMLDMQDFFYSSTQYDAVIVESAVAYLHGLAVELGLFMKEPVKMLEEISKLDRDALKVLRDQYRNQEKVNLIKFLVLDRIIETGSITESEMEEIKDEVKVRYETNILQSWNNFTILFQIYYYDKKQKVREELRKIHQAIRRIEQMEGLDFVDDKVLNGFNWNQNFGGSECWLAVYEVGHASHRTAQQFFVSISDKGISYGLLHGDQHPKRDQKNLDSITTLEQFHFERFISKMVEVRNDFTSDPNPPTNTEEISVLEWSELIANKEIVKETDLVYLHKMYELGGEATATQLANALEKHFSSFNSPVVQLAKRVMQATEVEPTKREDGTYAYWSVLFDGEYTDDQHFLWRLKHNLKEAISLSLDETEEVEVKRYTKEDFLQEVFINETQYDRIANLLQYKKNLILQGPPGVGKTFVSKRLAYSLIGKKDDSRLEIVQFHQNYAYEDFVMGFRPDEHGEFSLEFGVFYDFCQKAILNPEQSYYFIIDEINRGNLSKIFGELFMLLERDKRDEFVTMGYSKKKFTVPSNVYLIGTMNTADRSLAHLDVALRRRFAFYSLEPLFNEKWKQTIQASGVSMEMVERIIHTVEGMNSVIVQDFQLASGYAIGHSFFSEKPSNIEENEWFEGIVSYEIIPLLEEYFFDRPETVRMLIEEI